MTSDRNIPFTCADPWLLQAVILAAGDGSASLEQLVAAGDAVNHAIFTFEELNGGLARLVAAGLIHIDGSTFRPTGRAKKLKGEIDRAHRSVMAQRDALRAHLGAPEWSSEYEPGKADPAWSTAGLRREDLETAYAAYRRGARRAHHRTKGNGG